MGKIDEIDKSMFFFNFHFWELIFEQKEAPGVLTTHLKPFYHTLCSRFLRFVWMLRKSRFLQYFPYHFVYKSSLKILETKNIIYPLVLIYGPTSKLSKIVNSWAMKLRLCVVTDLIMAIFYGEYEIHRTILSFCTIQVRKTRHSPSNMSYG